MEAGTPAPRTPILADKLSELGAALPVTECPAPSSLPQLVAGLIFYLENGTVVPPEAPVVAAPQDARDAEIARLRAELDAAEAAKTAPPIVASPVAPVAPLPPPPAPPEAAPLPPVPAAPEPVPPAPTAGNAAAAPVDPLSVSPDAAAGN